MTGLVALVPLAELLTELTGSRVGATQLAVDVLSTGVDALPNLHDDMAAAARNELIRTGVITEAGVTSASRVAELIVVCDILAASTVPTPTLRPDPRLVLTAPAGSVQLRDIERLDSFVLDVIRRATTTLHIGGAFWNDEGFEALDAVLLPALRARHIPTTLYVNEPAVVYRALLDDRLARLRDTGHVTVRWFTGARPTMLHAKFVIRDRIHGYLGTANLTSWGMHSHIEAGVELTASQSERFVTFLEQLDAASLFSDDPPSATRLPPPEGRDVPDWQA